MNIVKQRQATFTTALYIESIIRDICGFTIEQWEGLCHQCGQCCCTPVPCQYLKNTKCSIYQNRLGKKCYPPQIYHHYKYYCSPLIMHPNLPADCGYKPYIPKQINELGRQYYWEQLSEVGLKIILKSLIISKQENSL